MGMLLHKHFEEQNVPSEESAQRAVKPLETAEGKMDDKSVAENKKPARRPAKRPVRRK